MSKENVLKQLQENVKIIYHKAVDADQKLQLLRKQEKAAFAQIFTDDSAFKNHSTTFLPYVEELAADLQEIQTDDEAHYKTLLPAIVVKIELLFKTLNSFKANLKESLTSSSVSVGKPIRKFKPTSNPISQQRAIAFSIWAFVSPFLINFNILSFPTSTPILNSLNPTFFISVNSSLSTLSARTPLPQIKYRSFNLILK